MTNQENENEEFYSSEESLLSEPEPDELDDEGEKKNIPLAEFEYSCHPCFELLCYLKQIFRK